MAAATENVEQLIEINRSRLRRIYMKHISNKEGKITPAEFQKFCRQSKIFPVRNM